MMMGHLLEIENLNVRFATDEGVLRAVDGVSITLDRGEVLGIVGESGCGKSAMSMSIPRLLPMPPASFGADRMLLDGIDLQRLSTREMCAIRGRRIGVIFQEPMTALSPLHRIGRQIEEAVTLHDARCSRGRAREVALEWLDRVGIHEPARTYAAYPHELSGGMQQRVMIAMALVNDPDLVIADEPTTALDVTTQAQILRLMKRLIGKNSALLLITHDMGVIGEMASRIAVMYAGQIVETATCAELFANPRHPYTKALLASMPSAATRGKRLPSIPGHVPSPFYWPSGCRFQERCPEAGDGCMSMQAMRVAGDGHCARCCRVG